MQARLDGAPFTELWHAEVLLQVCDGIAFAHSRCVAHRTLRLDKIVLPSVEPPKAVIFDIGLAEVFPASSADVGSPCTLAITAPEIIARTFSYKCDVWSLGCCF